MECTACVLMTKKHLELYIELLDNRINYLKLKRYNQKFIPELEDERADADIIRTCTTMRHHAYEALEKFR